MSQEAYWWLGANLLSIVILAFYSMTEMACVSFNKVRLHYYVSQDDQRSIWLNWLLQHPFRLFGTTLIGVNIAMVAGSECAREFHAAIGISPDLAPLSQVIIVVILGELAPMFAARHYAEHVAMLGAPLLYASAKLMSPLIYCVGLISRGINMLIREKETAPHLFLSQEELQKILEEQTEDPTADTVTEDFDAITSNIFSLRTKDAGQILTPLSSVPRIPSNSTIAHMRDLLKKSDSPYVLIYHQKKSNIVGIAFPRDMLRAQDNKRARDYAKAPWFITKQMQASSILHQFQKNKQTAAIVLNNLGRPIGIIHLSDLLEEIFGKTRYRPYHSRSHFILERTFPGDMLVSDFNAQFGVVLDTRGDLTLSEMITKHLGRDPEEGDVIYLDPFELIVKETSLLDIKSITVKSRVK